MKEKRLYLVLTTILFLGAYASAEEKPVPPKLLFKLSFDNGFSADYAVGASKIIKNQGVELTRGIFGKGAKIPANGYLKYPAGANLSKKSGTLLLWIRLNWTPFGTGDLSVGSKWHGIFMDGDEYSAKNRNLRAMISASLHYGWAPGSKPYNSFIIGKVHKNIWHHYVFTWDREESTSAYLDGIRIIRAYKNSHKEVNNPHMYIGSCGRPSPGRPGLDGIIDEVEIYDRALTPDEVTEKFSRVYKLEPNLLDYAAIAQKSNKMRISWKNISTQEAKENFTLTITEELGKCIYREPQTVSCAPGNLVEKSIDFTPPTTGNYVMTILKNNLPFKEFAIYALSRQTVCSGSGAPSLTTRPVQPILLDEINCAEEYGADRYRDDKSCRVTTSKAGTYRESTLTDKLCGFAYRLKPIRNPGQPHWLEIQYPDDKVRTFFIVVFQEKNGRVKSASLNTIGIITGDKYPITNKMQTKRLLFWPDTANQMVGCIQYKHYKGQAGPAISRIRLYEQNGSLPNALIPVNNNYPQRKIGLWQEDPTMTGYVWFKETGVQTRITLDFWREKWERIAAYMHYTGQNFWNMLTFDYYGDTAAGSHFLPGSKCSIACGRIPGWADVGAATLNREGIDFMASVQDVANISKLPYGGGIIKTMGIEHVSRDFSDASARGCAAPEIFNCENSLADTGWGHDKSPTGRLNPLHPAVQKAYLKIAATYCHKFGKYDHFKGVHFMSTKWSSLYFQSIKEGYGDYNTKIFQKETGIKIPVPIDDPARFSARYSWLMANAREAWTKWRASKILVFYQKLRNTICKDNPNRMLIISLRPNKYQMNAFESWPAPEADMGSYWRDCGIDFSLFANEPGILIMPAVEPNSDRIRLEHKRPAMYNWHYFGFAPEVSDPFLKYKTPAFMISHHSNMEVLPHANWKPLINSYWWPLGVYGKRNQMHCFSTPAPNKENVLEPLAHFLAESDAKILLHGWWGSPDNGDIETYQGFYRAFRSIPAVRFVDAPGASNDPVKVRVYQDENTSWFYLVNREYYPVKVSITLAGIPQGRLEDVVGGIEVLPTNVGENNRQLDLLLSPHEVQCYRGMSTLRITDVKQTAPKAIADNMKKELAELCGAMKYFREKGEDVSTEKVILHKIEQNLAKGNLSRARHLLQSGPIIIMKRRQGSKAAYELELADKQRFQLTTEKTMKKLFKQRTFSCARANGPIELDGITREKIWQRGPGTTRFVQFKINNNPVTKIKTLQAAQTTNKEAAFAKFCYDDSYLYALFICKGTPPVKVLHRKPAGAVFERESVELILCPLANDEFYKIAVDVSGFIHTTYGKTTDDTVDWNCKKWDQKGIKVGTKVYANQWRVEIAIPLTKLALEKAPTINTEWRFNALRNMKWRPFPGNAALMVNKKAGIACINNFCKLKFTGVLEEKEE